MNKYNVKATSGYISKYKLVAMLDEARKNETNGITDKTYEKAIEITETMDDADVAPVVHGRWEVVYNSVGKQEGQCTHCGKNSGILITKKSYCPNCGAKMDEREASGNV